MANIFDGRAKLVDATSKGKRLADAIPATPPSAPSALGDDELEELRRVLAKVRAGI